MRKEGLSLLQKCSYSEDLKEALLHVLRNDQNSGVRIAAIMVLDYFKDHTLVDPDVLKVLQEKIDSDENNYIRLIARNFLEEKLQ
jgi:HEAT repeat protein